MPQETPIKRFIRHVDRPTMLYAWTEALAAKPRMIECDIDGKLLLEGVQPEEKGKFISQMSKHDLLAYCKKEFGLPLSDDLKANEMRDIVKAEKELRDDAVARLMKEMFGKPLTEIDSRVAEIPYGRQAKALKE